MVLVGLYFNETLTEKYFDALRPSGLLRHYTEILQSPLFLGYSILGGLALAQLTAFHSTSPLILIQGFGIEPTTYGYLFASSWPGIFSAWLAGRLVEKHSIQTVLLAGMILFLVASAGLLVPALAGVRHWAAVVSPMALMMVGFSFALPQAAAAALTPFAHMATQRPALPVSCNTPSVPGQRRCLAASITATSLRSPGC